MGARLVSCNELGEGWLRSVLTILGPFGQSKISHPRSPSDGRGRTTPSAINIHPFSEGAPQFKTNNRDDFLMGQALGRRGLILPQVSSYQSITGNSLS